MPRLPAFEFEDAQWFPRSLRDGITDFLRIAAERTHAFRAAAPLLADLARRTGARRFIDLCSGGGGPLLWLRDRLEEQHGLCLPVVLTDLYPNRDAFLAAERRAPGRVHAHLEPVDATCVPAELDGVRTLFNALHHLPPEAARALFEDAANKRQPLAVFEVVDRSPGALAVIAAIPALTFALTPFERPLPWRRLALTYALPVIPAFVLWDGVASCLRAYSQEEVQALTEGIDVEGYRFEIGSLPMPIAIARLRYVVGSPTAL